MIDQGGITIKDATLPKYPKDPEEFKAHMEKVKKDSLALENSKGEKARMRKHELFAEAGIDIGPLPPRSKKGRFADLSEDMETLIQAEPYQADQDLFVLTSKTFCEDKNVFTKVVKVYLEEGGLLPKFSSLKTLTSACLFDLDWYDKAGRILDDMEFHESFQWVFHSLRKKFQDYIIVPPRRDCYLDIMVLGAMQSFFNEVWSYSAILDFNAPEHICGKTRAAKCVAFSSYNGKLGDITPGALRRLVEIERCTVLLDEIDKEYDKRYSAPKIFKALKQGCEKGLTYTLCDTTNGNQTMDLSLFGFKIFTRFGPIPEDLESSCISLTFMQKGKDEKVNPLDPTRKDFSEERNLLYLMKLKFTPNVRQEYDDVQKQEERIINRTRNRYLSYLTLARIISPELYEKILNHAREESLDMVSRLHKWENIVLMLVLRDHPDWRGIIHLKEITAAFNELALEQGMIRDPKFKLGGKKISNLLRNLQFEWKPPDRGGTRFVIDKENCERQIEVYLSEMGDTKSATSGTTQSSLDLAEGKREESKNVTNLEHGSSSQSQVENIQDLITPEITIPEVLTYLSELRSKTDIDSRFGEKGLRIVEKLRNEGEIYEPEEDHYQIL